MAPIFFAQSTKTIMRESRKENHDEVRTIAPIMEMGDAGNIGDIATDKNRNGSGIGFSNVALSFFLGGD